MIILYLILILKTGHGSVETCEVSFSVYKWDFALFKISNLIPPPLPQVCDLWPLYKYYFNQSFTIRIIYSTTVFIFMRFKYKTFIYWIIVQIIQFLINNFAA